MKRFAYLLFPLAALLNSFSMTALLLVTGLAGRFELAADIAIVQGASLALFFAFSANARNVVLAAGGEPGAGIASALMLTRLVLLCPLAAATFFLGVEVGGALAAIAVTLIVRRACEWVGEIALARHEVMGRHDAAVRVVVAEAVSLAACIGGVLFASLDLALCALPWALVPLLSLGGARLSFRMQQVDLHALLPHFGSTGIIGASVFVFRLSVTLLAGKELAGTLFTAFAIGSLVPTVFGQALLPTLIRRFGQRRLPWSLAIVPVVMIVVGALLAVTSLLFPQTMPDTVQPPVFWLASGLSIGGGAVMSIAMLLRTRLLHESGGRDVFGPDLLANVLIATCVPFIFYVFGVESLAGLYALSAFLNLGFLLGARRSIEIKAERHRWFLYALAGALIFPIFFQVDGGLFRDTAFVFDAQGVITKLPLPLSIAAMIVGIGLLGNYWQASRTLTTLFFSALLFVLTSLVVAQGSAHQEGAKLILLAQYLLPMFGLVLGEMFGMSEQSAEVLQRTACVILLGLLPMQLVAGWVNGFAVLTPHVFIFSIYQHQLFFPAIVSALVMLVAIPLWAESGKGSRAVALLLPVSAVYFLSAHSVAAVMGFVLGLAGIGWFYGRNRLTRGPVMTLLFTAIAVMVVFAIAKETGWLGRLLNSGQVILLDAWLDRFSPEATLGLTALPPWISERLALWAYFFSGTFDSLPSFLIGHAVPTQRSTHPSALNYWLDAAFNFGIVALMPLLLLLMSTLRMLWRGRGRIPRDASLFGLALAVIYLLLFVNMLKVGMRQPYPGIITFFLWGVLVARLRISGDASTETGRPA
jgi:hypothetical protein